MNVLISDHYRELNRKLHAGGRFGRHGDKWAHEVLAMAREAGLHDLLDYGCGQGTLATALAQLDSALTVREYDPAIAGKDLPPLPADGVVCTDVLEHIEPEHLSAVLGHLQALTRRLLFAVVSTRPAKKLLEDGRNAHLIVMPEEDWRAALAPHFNIRRWQSRGDEFAALLVPVQTGRDGPAGI